MCCCNKRKILIVGGSSELAQEVIGKLIRDGNMVGIHYSTNKSEIAKYGEYPNAQLFCKTISCEKDCEELIAEFIKWTGNIDNLLVLMGAVSHTCDWSELSVEDMQWDYLVNAVYPFQLAKYACEHMKTKGGNIIFVSTASAKRGGGSRTLGYGMSKYAVECMTKRLARDLAQYNISVNAIAPGFFDTKFHLQCKTQEEIEKRTLFVPMGRAGTKKEFAGLVFYLLSDEAKFVTGQIITIDGGDFI